MLIWHLLSAVCSATGILLDPQHNAMDGWDSFQGKEGQILTPVAECDCFCPVLAKGDVPLQLHFCLRWAQLPGSLF